MGIFNSKHDDAQTITPNTDTASVDTATTSPVATPTEATQVAESENTVTASSTTTPVADSVTDGFLTTNEPTSAPEVAVTETTTSAPEVSPTSGVEDATVATPEVSTVATESSAEESVVSPVEPVTIEDPVPTPSVSPISVRDASDSEDLNEIKEEALKQLSPLISKLDQTPEEKFHTAMMMVQSTDDKTLIKTAYEAAQAITDETDRAQALLDIVNEINYFSQQSNTETN